MISQEFTEKIDRCIEGELPFALIFMPGETAPRWFAPGDPDSSPGDVAVRRFGIGTGCKPSWLMASDKTHTGACQCVAPIEQSTQYQQYISSVQDIIDGLKSAGGKTVISRLIAVESAKPFGKVVDEYFSLYPWTMRFVYYLPQLGLWFGASPELLIDYQYDTESLRTMSLAGTRTVGAGSPWDAKNIAEHQFVTDFIIDTLSGFGLDVVITDSNPLQFGNIEHLCDRISARGIVDPSQVVDALSPTPALCGTPREQAYRQIMDTETHCRHCYGGWIGIRTPQRFTAYVNLRSALAAPLPDGRFRYNVYVGGGITADSDPESEWRETQAKAASIINCISNR